MTDIKILIKTKKELVDALGSLGNLIDSTHSTEFKASSLKDESLLTEMAQDILNDCKGDIELFRTRIEEIEDSIRKMDKVNVKMPFYPSSDFIDNVHKMIAEDRGNTNFILDIEVDKKMTPGAEVSFGGRYLKLSLKDYIRQILTSKDAKRRNI